MRASVLALLALAGCEDEGMPVRAPVRHVSVIAARLDVLQMRPASSTGIAERTLRNGSGGGVGMQRSESAKGASAWWSSYAFTPSVRLRAGALVSFSGRHITQLEPDDVVVASAHLREGDLVPAFGRGPRLRPRA